MRKQVSSNRVERFRSLNIIITEPRKRWNRQPAMLSLAAAAAASLAGASMARAQSEIVGWNTTSLTYAAYPNDVPTFAATTYSSGLAAAPTLSYNTEGNPYGTPAGLNPQSPQYYGSGYLFWSSQNSSTLAGAQAQQQFVQFTLTPNAGQAMDIDSIVVPDWFSQNNFATTMYVTSSLNGYATSLGSAALTSGATISLGSALQNVTSPITIQLDIAGSWGYQGAGFGGLGNSGDALEVIGTVAAPVTPLTWTGLSGSGGSATWAATTDNNWKATAGGAATYGDGDPVTFDNTGTNTNITVSGGGVNPGAILFNSGTYTLGGGPIGGTTATSLTLSGATLTLNGSNTYPGGTTVAGGTLNVGNNSALGTGTLIVNSGTVNFTASGPSVSSLSGTGGNIVLSNTTLSVGSDNTTRFAGTLSQAASTTGGLIKVGSGALSLSGSNTYKGNTLINAGTLLAVNSAGSATGSGSVIVASNAILGGSGLIVPSAGNSVTIQSGGILSPHVTANGYSKLTVTGALNLNAGSILNFNFGSAGNDEVVANSIAFGGNSETLNVAFPNGVAAGVYPILKASSFSGQASPVFTVNGTTADAYTILAPGAPGNTFTNAYALQAVAQTTTWTGASSGNWDTNEANWNGPAGTMYSDGEPVVFDNTPLQYSSQFTVSVQSTVTPASVIFNNSIGNNYTITTPYNIGTVISGSCGVYINGTGTVTFGAVTYEGNSYTGGTFLNAGVLNINDDDKLGTVPAANAVNLVFNGGTLQAGIADLQISGTRTIQLNAGGGTLDTNANEMEIEGNLIQGSGGLTVIGGGTLKFHDGYYNNPVGNLDQNTYSGGTVVNGATIEVVETDSSSVPAYPAAGPITSGLFGTGAVSLNNGSALLEDNYKETYYANAFNLSGALTIQPPTNGLFFTATAGNVTTLTGNTTLNLLNAHVYGNENPVYLNLLAPVVGAHSIAVNGLDTSAVYTGVVFGSAANTFSGGLSVTNAEIQVGDALSSTVSGGVVTSGPLGTGLVTLHANSVLFGLDDGTDTDVVSNSFLIDGNTTLISGHGHFWIDSNGSTGSTFTLANTPTITNSTGYGKMYIRNYVLQGTGFTLLDNHTSSGGGNPLIIYSPGLSQTGMTTSVTLDSSSLVYDVNTLSSPASFEFGQQAINISGGSFTFNTATSGYGQTGTLTNAINVDSNGGTLAGDNTVASSVFSGPVNTIGTLNVSEAVLTGAITGGGTVALEGDNNNNNANSGVILRSAATVTNDFTVTGPPPFTPYNISIGSSDNGSGGVSSTFSGTVAIASSGNVNLTAAAGGTLKFTNIISGSGASITKVGSGTVILSGSNTYSGTTNLSSGTLQFAREVALYGDNTAVWASNLNVSSNSGATLAVNVGGPGEFTSSDLDILQTTLKGGTNLGFDTTNAAGGNFTYGSTITDAPGTYQHVGVVKLGPNSLTLTASNTYSGGTTIQGGVLVASSGLAGVGIGTITVNGGGAIFRNTSAGTVNNLLQGGYNSGGWNGPYGIVSNTAASDPKYLHAVGELQPSTPTTFQGQPLGTGDVAIKYTYYGDSNLDGKVDGTDYSRIDNGYLQGLSGWQNGDFNYDGVINGSDYTLIDNAYNTQGAQISAETASATAQIAGVSGSSAVPEPATLGLLGIAAVGLLGRPRLGKRRR